MKKLAIFDMDGTILDTSEDLSTSLNYAMEKCGHRHNYTAEDIKNFFGSGVQVAITRALAYENGASLADLVAIGTKEGKVPEAVTQQEIDKILTIFNPYYADHCKIKTGPFPGILDLLKNLRKAGIKLAVVSNKPDQAVRILVKDHFDGYFDFVLGQSSKIRRKPNPDMTIACLKELDADKENSVYIGDSEIDLQTAANSGLDEIAVTWGFRKPDFLIKHGATTLVDNTSELYNEIVK